MKPPLIENPVNGAPYWRIIRYRAQLDARALRHLPPRRYPPTDLTPGRHR